MAMVAHRAHAEQHADQRTQQTADETVDEVLERKRYAETIERWSSRFHDLCLPLEPTMKLGQTGNCRFSATKSHVAAGMDGRRMNTSLKWNSLLPRQRYEAHERG